MATSKCSIAPHFFSNSLQPKKLQAKETDNWSVVLQDPDPDCCVYSKLAYFNGLLKAVHLYARGSRVN